jgi:hypothetical protein
MIESEISESKNVITELQRTEDVRNVGGQLVPDLRCKIGNVSIWSCMFPGVHSTSYILGECEKPRATSEPGLAGDAEHVACDSQDITIENEYMSAI